MAACALGAHRIAPADLPSGTEQRIRQLSASLSAHWAALLATTLPQLCVPRQGALPIRPRLHLVRFSALPRNDSRKWVGIAALTVHLCTRPNRSQFASGGDDGDGCGSRGVRGLAIPSSTAPDFILVALAAFYAFFFCRSRRVRFLPQLVQLRRCWVLPAFLSDSSGRRAPCYAEAFHVEAAALPRRISYVPVRSGFRALASMSSESAANNPGLYETPDDATKGYFLQQTMYRIKDPKVSLDFYTRILGMSLLKRLDFPESKFSLYFIGFEDTANAPTDSSERTAWTFGKKATLELTHNWGTESDENFKGHHNGNSDPKGYGHIGVTVDDTHKACARFEKLGVKFVKKPDEGKMKGIAFIQDPDGYWIELFDIQSMKSVA